MLRLVPARPDPPIGTAPRGDPLTRADAPAAQRAGGVTTYGPVRDHAPGGRHPPRRPGRRSARRNAGRRIAHQAGLHLSVRELLAQLARIQQTVLLYPGQRGRPKARHMITDRTDLQQQLFDLFDVARWAPPVR